MAYNEDNTLEFVFDFQEMVTEENSKKKKERCMHFLYCWSVPSFPSNYPSTALQQRCKTTKLERIHSLSKHLLSDYDRPISVLSAPVTGKKCTVSTLMKLTGSCEQLLLKSVRTEGCYLQFERAAQILPQFSFLCKVCSITLIASVFLSRISLAPEM